MNLIFLDEFYLLERYINVVFHFISFVVFFPNFCRQAGKLLPWAVMLGLHCQA